MDRVTDREFADISEGVLASTGGDMHGDRLAPELLRDFREQMKEDPEQRLLRLDHNPEDVVGEILDVWIEEADDEDILLLKGEIGVFEGEKQAKKMFESDIFGGFSVSVAQVRGMQESEWEDKDPAIQIETPAGERHYLEWLLQESELGYRVTVQKAGPGAAIFEFLNANQSIVEELVKLVSMYYLSKRLDGEPIQLPDISLVNVEVDIDVELLQRVVVSRLDYEYNGEEIAEEDVEEVVEEEVERMRSE